MTQKSYFRSSGFLTNDVIHTDSGSLDLTKLPPFLRSLLVTDGTVTKSLEAWFWEKVVIQPIRNHSEILTDTILGLEVEDGDKVLHREVILKGVTTDSTYATARSTVSLKYLPDDVSQALIKSEIGIGELLREKGVETYRDIFDINYFISTVKQDSLLSSFESDVLSRSYRIRVNGHPAMIVTEYFPLSIYQ